jgi:hypothetical protein
MSPDRTGPRRTGTARRRPRLQVEPLEDRRLLSTIAALTASNQLLRFDDARPDTILATTPITGLQAGDSVVGIDVRPATGQLYGLGRASDGTGRLYTINPLSGAATLVASLTAAPGDPFTTLNGTDFGIDFNPVPDRLRVVGAADQNLRINPTTGSVITDTPLAFAAGDRNAGQNPSVVDVAYTNDVAGAGTTTLYGLDANLLSQKTLPDGSTVMSLTLVRQGGIGVPPGTPSPNTGQLVSIGAFGRTGVTPAGLDVAPGGTAFVAIGAQAEGTSAPRSLLLTLDLATGADSSHGPIGDGTTAIRDIAVLPSVQFSAPLYAVAEDGGGATITVTRTEGSVGTVTVDFATGSGTATAGADFTSTAGTLTFGPGETTKTVTVPILNDAAAEGDESLTLTLSNPTGGAVVGGPGTVTLRINASDGRDRTGPVITRVLETGPSRGITGAVLQFNEDLDPTRAGNVANYSLFGIGQGGRRTRIALGSAAYDPVARTVTLTAGAPFMQTQFRQLMLRVNGRRGGLTDLAGNRPGARNRRPGGDAVFRFAVFSGTTVTFTDRDGDRATLNIANGGRLDGIRPLQGPATQNTQFWILDPIALRSTLGGSVQRSPRGDGIVVIAEIIGLDKKEFTPLLSNTSFRVNTLTFSSNATGIG